MRRSVVPRGNQVFVVVTGVVLAVLLAWSSPASAGRGDGRDSVTEGGLTLAAEAGYNGGYLPGRRLPVRVSITADRLLRGRIEVTVRDQAGTYSTAVEVPGGSDKEVLLVVPTPAMFEVRSVRVRLLLGGEEATLVVEPEIHRFEDEQAVGLLPSVTPPDQPEPLVLGMDAGTARFVAVDETTLATPGALDPLGTVAAGPDDLGRLDATARRGLLDWVDQGGRLVLDAAPGTEIAGLPEAWQPTDAAPDRRSAGLGEVRLVGGAVAAQRWAEVVEPTPTVASEDLQQLGGPNFPIFESSGDAVARDAGLQSLELRWLLGFLLAYVVVAGPLAWLVLRRWRPAMGWIVVPGVAVAFTVASFAIGTDLRSGTRAAHGSVVELAASGDRVTATIGSVSRNGTDSVSRFPAGWTGGGTDSSFFGGVSSDPGISIVSDGTGTEATLPLAAGGYGVVRGTGPSVTDAGGGLVVTATATDGHVTGTIENTLPYALEEVVAFAGFDGDRVGTIAPGETVDFEVRGNELRTGDPWNQPESRVWQTIDPNTGMQDFDSVVNLSIWTDLLVSSGPNSRPRGLVTVVGWTRDYTPEVQVAGQAEPSGRTAIVARVPVTTDGEVVPGSSHRELLRGPSAVDLDRDEVEFSPVGTIWRFTAPEGATGPLAFDIPSYIGRLDVWDGTAWVPIFESDGQAAMQGNFAQVRHAALPAGVVGPVVVVRGWQVRDFATFDGVGLDLVSLDPEEVDP